MKYLFTTEDSFQLKDLGCVVVKTFPLNEDFPELKVGDHILLEPPENKSISCIVKGIQLINYGKMPNRLHFSIQLPSIIDKEDVPAGTKVYWVDSEAVK
jgi:hypothetical protein